MTTATGRRSQSALGWETSSTIVPPEELKVLRLWRPNVLIGGDAEFAAAALAALSSGFRAPIVQWRAGDSFPSSELPATLILDDLAELSRPEQEGLFAWLEEHFGAVQVVAITAKPLLPLVQSGEFLAPLYYALNVIHLEIPK